MGRAARPLLGHSPPEQTASVSARTAVADRSTQRHEVGHTRGQAAAGVLRSMLTVVAVALLGDTRN